MPGWISQPAHESETLEIRAEFIFNVTWQLHVQICVYNSVHWLLLSNYYVQGTEGTAVDTKIEKTKVIPLLKELTIQQKGWKKHSAWEYNRGFSERFKVVRRLQTEISSCFPILFRCTIILKLVMLLKGALKSPQTRNISQMKNDAKISNKGKKWSLWHKTCSSLLHWTKQVPKAELKDMWQGLVGYRNLQGKKKMHPLGCMTCVLSAEHGIKETGLQEEEKAKECMWQHSEKYDRKLDKCQDSLTTCY